MHTCAHTHIHTFTHTYTHIHLKKKKATQNEKSWKDSSYARKSKPTEDKLAYVIKRPMNSRGSSRRTPDCRMAVGAPNSILSKATSITLAITAHALVAKTGMARKESGAQSREMKG